MEAYPPEYVAHNLPLVVLSGLSPTQELGSKDEHREIFGTGTVISSELPPVDNELGQHLLQDFLSGDGAALAWNSEGARSRNNLIGFKFKVIGRVRPTLIVRFECLGIKRLRQEFRLPARKAAPPALSHPLDPTDFSPGGTPPPRPVLHSPISPLSPGSPVYPDGLISAHWLAKHQDYIPSAFVSFFNFSSDPSRNSLNDNQLKNEINAIKSALYRSEYKIRYAVVLLSDKTISQSPDIEDRLGNIRRATGLDPKNSLFFLPLNSSRVEVSSFASSILYALQPFCIEYYRELSKHARRKKNRGNIPPPTVAPTRGTSQTLSTIGWGVRYDIKQGVFAEFRQEMDSASRHYQSALEALLGPDGVFETTVSWSPRWEEARLLADTLALRVIRCSLWNNLTTTATQCWINYRSRIRDLIDRRGKGSSNYGWEAWESRWAKMMAQLIQRADLPIFSLVLASGDDSRLLASQLTIYAPAEKIIPIGERLPPSQLLHHPGYWLRRAAKHAIARRKLADDIPDEHRTPPGQSPASTTASRHGTYDTYLCLEPHLENPLPQSQTVGHDHVAEILDLLNQASGAFYDRNQKRQADRLQLEAGRELIHAGRYSEASNILKPLWESMTCRKEKWWQLAGQVSRALNSCARQLADLDALIATQFELLSALVFSHPSESHDFMNCTDGIVRDPNGAEVAVSVSSGSVIAPIIVKLSFLQPEGHAGDGLPFQLTLHSRAQQNSKPVTFNRITARFRGGKHELCINHLGNIDEAGDSHHSATFRKLSFSETPSSGDAATQYEGQTDLTLHPGQILVLESNITFREAGEAAIEDLTLEIKAKDFTFQYISNAVDSEVPAVWWLRQGSKLKTLPITRADPASIRVLPRPPKMDISIPDASRQFYADEKVVLDIEVTNHEDEETESTLEVRLMSRDTEVPPYTWLNSKISSTEAPNDSTLDLPGFQIGRLAPGATSTQSISFTAPQISAEMVIEVKVLYHLFSDRNTPVSKVLSTDITIIRALEANHDLQPRVHPEPWPSFFTVDTLQEKNGEVAISKAVGITQKWELIVRLGSFAEEGLTIKSIVPVIDGTVAGIATFAELPGSGEPTDLPSRGLIERSFIVDITKASLEERRPTVLSLSARIEWLRANAPDQTQATTTVLQFSDIVVPNSEPRVICTAQLAPNPSTPGLMQLDYTLENPTFHFLTFDITMEASEDFAFSGPKFGAVNLLPLSRTSVRFDVLPLVRGEWINPSLKVMDRWFGKQLRILPGEGCRNDKKGIAVWVDKEDDAE